MQPRSLLFVAGAIVAVGCLVAAVRMKDPVAPASAAPVATAPLAPIVTTQPIAPTPTTIAKPSPSVVSADSSPPSADDPFVRRAAIEEAIAKKDLSALPEIEKTDLTVNGYLAASAIDAVGKLGAIAPPADKREAVRTLARWLREESLRKTNDAAGNVSILVDALADTKSEEAVAPLVAALDSATHPLFLETRIVQALDALGAKSAAASVERFAVRVRALQPQSDFEKELAKEALEAAEASLTRWRG